MINKTGGHIWWWVLPALIVMGGLGYYWYSQTGPKPEKALVAGDLSPVDKKAPSKGAPGIKDLEGEHPEAEDVTGKDAGGKAFPIEKKALPKKRLGVGTLPMEKEVVLQEMLSATEGQIERLFELGKNNLFRTDGEVTRLFEPRKGDSFGKTPADKIYCDLIDEYVADFFAYLNTEKYIERLDLKTDTYSYFKRIIERLAARPPVPAGEGLAPTIMVKNVFFFSRALDRKDLRLFKEVVVNERDTLEINLEMFYRWIMLGKLCPNPGQVRLPFDVMYRYAGFFLNTTGGRAYLFRRSVTCRLLLTYYSVLVVHQSDRLGKNSYGINIFPYIQPLRKEISHYPDFEFQNQYVRTLTRIENYYLQKR